MKTQIALISFLAGFAFTGALFTCCPSAPSLRGEPPVMVDSSPVIAPDTATQEAVEPQAASFDELSEAIAIDVIDRISQCPNEHRLVATFQDGSTAYMPIPRFDELMQNLNGDLSIFKIEVKSAVISGLEMGAVSFELIDIGEELKGTGV